MGVLLGTPRRAAVFASVAYAILAGAVAAPLWVANSSSWIGGTGDPFKFMSFLAWLPHALTHGQNPLFLGAVDYPKGVNLAWETPVPLAGFLMWPVTASLGAAAAYNVWVMVALTLDGWCTFLWLRRHTRSRWTAFLGGLITMVGPYVAGHILGHLNLISFFPIPLMFLVVERLTAGSPQRLRVGVLLGVLGAAQFFLSEELVALTAIAVVTAGLAALLIYREPALRRIRTALPALAVAAASGVTLTGPMIVFQFLGPYPVRGHIQPFNVYVTDLANLVVPTRLTWLEPPVQSFADVSAWTGNVAEQTGYVGLPILLLTIYASARWWREPFVRIVAVTTLVAEILSFGSRLHIAGHDPGIYLPGALLTHMPVLDNLLPGRLSLISAFGCVALAVVGLDRLWSRGGRLAWAALAFAAAGVASGTARVPFIVSSTHVPTYFTARDGARALPANSVALVLPFIDTGTGAVSMLWQATADFRFSLIDGLAISADAGGRAKFLVEGPLLDAFHTIQSDGVLPIEIDALRAQLRTQLASDGVTVVIVGSMAHRTVAIAFVEWLEGGPGTKKGEVDVWTTLH